MTVTQHLVNLSAHSALVPSMTQTVLCHTGRRASTAVTARPVLQPPTLSFRKLAASSTSLRSTSAEISSGLKSFFALELSSLTLPPESALTL